MDLTLLAPEQEADANEHGWTIAHVYDMKSNQMIVEIVPHAGMYPSAQAAFRTVWDQAAERNATCIAALQLIKQFPPLKVNP